jgi:peptidoglycan hydrolase CwlO-like protein
MSTVYNPESEIVAQIERLELEARDIRRKIDYVRNDNDRRVLNRQLKELEEEITNLQAKLP